MFVTVLLNNQPTSVYAEEAAFLVARGLAVYPGTEKAIEKKEEKAVIENKMIEKASKTKREKKVK